MNIVLAENHRIEEERNLKSIDGSEDIIDLTPDEAVTFKQEFTDEYWKG